MNFLKKVGQIIAAVTGKIATAAPLVGQLVTSFDPAAAPYINVFEGAVGAVISVEGAVAAIANSNISGADKARAAGALVGQIIQLSPFMKGKDIADGEKFKNACATIAGGIADLLNSLKG
jgi:hypothetical protein